MAAHICTAAQMLQTKKATIGIPKVIGNGMIGGEAVALPRFTGHYRRS